MPEYDTPEYLRLSAYASGDWRERYYPTSSLPNRRGDYPNATKWSYSSKFYWRSKGATPRKWSPKKQVASANKADGTRSLKKYKARTKARAKGFQHAWIPPEKPKVPKRVLRDAQEERLWVDEICLGS